MTAKPWNTAWLDPSLRRTRIAWLVAALVCVCVLILAGNTTLRDLSAQMASRQSHETIALWTSPPAGSGLVAGPEVTEYRSTWFGSTNRTVRNIAVPSLTLVRPKVSNGAAILIIPGGGYGFIAIDSEGLEVARYFSKLGFTTYVLKYRLPGEGWSMGPETPLQDAQRAMRIIRARAGQDRISPDKVAVIGFSAGGHLAGSLASRFDAPMKAAVDDIDRLSARPDLSALVYPVATLRAPFGHEGSKLHLLGKGAGEAQIARYSLDTSVRANAPPAFIVHARDDAVVPIENAILLQQAYQGAKQDVTLITLDTGGHGFGLGQKAGKQAAQWPGLFLQWAREREFPATGKGSDGL
jgi:acetyl esterase/lipase